MSCSSQRNSWTSKAYHNTTAHFNGYFYALDEINKIETTLIKSEVDDYSRILRLYPTFDSTMAKGYEKETEEAIKMASLVIQHHQNSKWVDDAYIVVGKARHYSLDWGNAIQTFKHVNTKSLDLDAKHLAIISLIRTYIEHKEFNNAQAAIDYLEKQELSNANKKKFYLEKAYFYQLNHDYENMAKNLTQASPYIKKKDRKSRIYFIMGQVNQKLGLDGESYQYYKKCIATNPPYELDFYARLYMAQVTEVSKKRDIQSARNSFTKLLKDKKNKEFKDRIYYEMGVFELKNNNIPEAIKSFNHSVRNGNNKKLDGEAYLKLGQIYYDTLKNYELSQAYYDSAVNALPSDYEGYDKIKSRHEILNEFVKHLKTIQWQDSLLTLASYDSVKLRQIIDSVVTEKKLRESLLAKNKKRSNRIDIASNTNDLFSSGEEDTNNNADGPSTWYFYNPAAISMGQTEFARIWGNIPLEDNWRRSQRQATVREASETSETDSTSQDNTTDVAKEVVTDPVDAEYMRISQEIPKTEEAKKEALAKIEEAYFGIGEIYYLKLKENKNAVERYEMLLKRFPETAHEPEVLYTLYLILKDSDSVLAEQYASLLKTKHPHSTFTKILLNPNYLQESGLASEKQKELYKIAYEKFQDARYDSANLVINQALALGETTFNATLHLLRILIIGKTQDISKYQYELDQFIINYPDTESAAYAKKLLESSRQYQLTKETQKGIQYIRSFEEPHYFVITYKKTEGLDAVAPAVLDTFNVNYFSELNLKTTNMILNDEYVITFVSEIPRVNSAIEYFKTFNERLPLINELQNYKFDSFVITKDNFDIFYRTKGLDEYIQFFQRNYPVQNQ
jgi:tetratricopeptide (TPR) repeat protein